MEYVNEQIERVKEEVKQLESEMYLIQQRYHVFEKQANRLWSAGQLAREDAFRPFAEIAGDEIWDPMLALLDERLDEHSYDKCKAIIEKGIASRKERVKVLVAFVKACPHVMARKLQADLCSKSHECLVKNRELNALYIHANRAFDSYQASTTDTMSSTQQGCVL